MRPLICFAAALATALPSLAMAADAPTLVDALDLPAEAVISATTSGLFDQSDVRDALGPIAATSDDMVLLSSGYASQVLSGQDHDLGTTGYDPTEPVSPVYDQALLELTLQVPEGMHSLKFDWYFLSREYPFYVGSSFNDRFTVMQSGALFDGNIVFDENGSVVDVNNALFTVTDALSLEGTGFWRPSSVSPTGFDGGGTGWVTTQTPVQPGEVVDLRIDVHDVADGVYDSGVVIDNFRWSEEEVDDPKSGADLELHWLSPKSASIDGGDTVLVTGRRFTADTRVWVGGVEVAEVVLHGDNLIEVTVPAAPDGAPGLVDVVAENSESAATLLGAFTWVTRSNSGTPPTIATVDPDHAEAAGGGSLTITGEGFDSDSVVLFGDAPAAEQELLSDTELRVVLPELEPGSMLLRVVDADGRSSGGPLPFVARTKLDEPSDSSSPVTGGCNSAGGSPAGPWALLALVLVAIVTRRAGRVVSLRGGAATAVVAALMLTGCGNDYRIRPGVHPHPEASAFAMVGETARRDAQVPVGSPVALDGQDSRGFDGATLSWHWQLLEAPEGSEAELEGTADRWSRATFTPDMPGAYLVELVVSDHRGRRSHPSAIAIEATDADGFRVRLEWDGAGHDLDLHLLRSGGEYFADGDCFYGRPRPAWGDVEIGRDDPRHLQDADGSGDQLRREEVLLPAPAPGSYTVLVHHLNDRGSLQEVAAELTLWHDGEEIALELGSEQLEQDDVWRAFSISVPGGTVTELGELTTHQALGGPDINLALDSDEWVPLSGSGSRSEKERVTGLVWC